MEGTQIEKFIPEWAGKPGQRVQFSESYNLSFAEWAALLSQGNIQPGDEARIATGFVKNNKVAVFWKGYIIHNVSLDILKPL